jgi:hypothetical protein
MVSGLQRRSDGSRRQDPHTPPHSQEPFVSPEAFMAAGAAVDAAVEASLLAQSCSRVRVRKSTDLKQPVCGSRCILKHVAHGHYRLS